MVWSMADMVVLLSALCADGGIDEVEVDSGCTALLARLCNGISSLFETGSTIVLFVDLSLSKSQSM